jgi:hypothetical protein
MDYVIKVSEEELQLILISLEGNKNLKKNIKDQAWNQVLSAYLS